MASIIYDCITCFKYYSRYCPPNEVCPHCGSAIREECDEPREYETDYDRE
jgi:rRNA maturation endonuclease Nob1